MKVEVGAPQMRSLAFAEPDDQEAIINRMTPEDALSWDADFESWAHEAQLPPKLKGWRTWLMLAGRGFGKTRAGAEWIDRLARSRPGVRIALLGATIDEARRVMVEGVSGIIAVARTKGVKVSWEPSLGRVKWSNGSQAQIFSGDSPDGLRGPEHDFAWCFDCARYDRGGSRRGTIPQRSSRPADSRSLLSHRLDPHRRLGAICGSSRRVYGWRLEVHRARSRNVRAGENRRDCCRIWIERVGNGGNTG
jgi:hypothetical protein